MKNSFVSLSLILLAVSLAACTGRTSVRNIHEGPQAYKDAEPTVQPSELKAFVTSEDFNEAINNAKSFEEVKPIIEKLGASLLNERMLESAQARSIDFVKALSLLNRAITKGASLDLKALKASGWLKRYQDAVLDGCTKDLNDCNKLTVFNRDHLSSNIFLTSLNDLIASLRSSRAALKSKISQQEATRISAQYRADLQNFYEMLPIAIVLNNSSPSENINMLFVEFGTDYLRMTGDQAPVASLRRHQTQLNLSLVQLRESLNQNSRSKYCQVINDLNPLHMQADLKQWIDQRTIRSYVEDFFECNSTGTVIENLVKESLLTEENSQKAAFLEAHPECKTDTSAGACKLNDPVAVKRMSDLGFFYTKADVETWPELFHTLDIKINDTQSMGFYVIDNIFYEKMDSAMIQSLWKRTRLTNDDAFFDLMRNYARLQVAYATKLTITNFSTLLRNQFAKEGSIGADSFEEIQKHIDTPSKEQWDIVDRRLRRMKDFLVQTFDQKYARANMTGEQAKTQQKFNSLKQELDSTYSNLAVTMIKPLEIAMFYYMAKAQGQIQLKLSFLRDPITINASSALRSLLLYSDRSLTFFGFGPEVVSIEGLEIQHFFDYALRIGIFDHIPFDLYQSDKEARLSTENFSLNSEYLFFAQVFKDLFSYHQQQINKETDRLTDFKNDVTFWKRFDEACENPLQAPVSFDSNTEIRTSTLKGDKNLFNRLSTIYNSKKVLNSWRTERRGIDNFVNIMKAHLREDANLSPEKLAARPLILAEIDKLYRSYTDQEIALNKIVFELDQRVVNSQRNCLTRIYEADLFRKRQILAESVTYYHDVHAAMTLLGIADGKTLASELKGAADQWLNDNKDSSYATGVHRRMQNLVAKADTAGLLGSENYSLENALNDLLGIHNLRTLRDRNVGFFVEGVEAFEEAPFKRIKRLNNITEKSFQNGYWDTLMRVRTSLQTSQITVPTLQNLFGLNATQPIPLAEHLLLPLGSFAALENDGLYNGNRSEPVPFDKDPTHFVQTAMKQLAGDSGGDQFLYYLSDSGLEVPLLRERRAWFRDLSIMGTFPTEMTDIDNCPKDAFGQLVATQDLTGQMLPGKVQNSQKPCHVRRVTAEQMITAFIENIRFYNTSGFENTEVIDEMPISDKDLLFWTQRYQKNLATRTGELSFRSQVGTKHWTYFEELFRSTFFVDGEREDILGMRGFRRLRDLYIKNIRSAGFLIAPRVAPMQVMRTTAREAVLRPLLTAIEFQRAVEKMENEKYRLPHFVIERTDSRQIESDYLNGWRAMLVHERSSGPRAGTPIYLKDVESVKSFYESSLRSSIVDIDCEFLPREPVSGAMAQDLVDGLLNRQDLDYTDAIKAGTCAERYAKWRQHISLGER